jgi:hypothetical protein
MATVGPTGGPNGTFPGGATGNRPTGPPVLATGTPAPACRWPLSASWSALGLTAHTLVAAFLCTGRGFFCLHLRVSVMAGGRKQAGTRVPNEGGPAKLGVKGKNFNRAEEEQLCRSVLFVSQDRIVGNQQRAGVFWERISDHYDEHRLDAPRPQRSLETKWGLIKHDVSSFCGIYSQILRLNKSGTSVADTLRNARDLYKQKSAKKQEFAFEHCWLLLKDHPKWADGWSSPKPASSMRPGNASDRSPTEPGDIPRTQFDAARSPGTRSVSEADCAGSQRPAISRPGGSKAAREECRSNSAREGAIYAQAEATRTMAAAQMKKAALLEDQNMLLLMMMPDDKITTSEAREYLRLRRGDELKKLRRRIGSARMRLWPPPNAVALRRRNVRASLQGRVN